MQPSPNEFVALDGLIKVRLVHAKHGSILLPDLVMVDGTAPYWVQPQWVPPSVLQLNPPGRTALYVGIANVQALDVRIEVEFDGDGFFAALSDRSHLYRCRIRAPANLEVFKAGRWRQSEDGKVQIKVYHHTTPEKKKLILESSEVWGSPWNFQGTKKLTNCSYAYFTSLPYVTDWRDLQRIGMASDGALRLQLDQTPSPSPPDLVIEVYRESTENREARLGLWVPVEHVAPSHVWMHRVGRVEYELAQPWIFRVGLVIGGTYRFHKTESTPDQPDLKQFEYLVLGDCTTLAGLEAPYDEEDTRQTFLIQEVTEGTVFDAWIEHSNQPLWHQDVEGQEFEQPGD